LADGLTKEPKKHVHPEGPKVAPFIEVGEK
jgi:hypothetical protein